jgi:hypothetical protein
MRNAGRRKAQALDVAAERRARPARIGIRDDLDAFEPVE